MRSPHSTSRKARVLKESAKKVSGGPAASEAEDSFYDIKLPLGTSETRVISSTGRFGRALVIRLRPGTDLFRGIRAACEKHGVRGGMISCVFGSLQKCCLGYVRPSSEPHMRSGLDYIRLTGPIEFSSAQGTITETGDGGIFIHIHGVVADRHNRCYAGHFIEGENIVLANMEVVIAEIVGMKMGRKVEPELGWELLDPTPGAKIRSRRPRK
jgi:predicted DNA-binding protein with PD1-like motif